MTPTATKTRKTDTSTADQEKIRKAMSRAGISTDLSGYTEAQLGRALEAPSSMTGDKLRRFIMGTPAGGRRPDTPQRSRRTGTVAEIEAAGRGFDVAASKKNPLSQRISPAQIRRIRKAVDGLDGKGSIPERLGLSEAALRKFVTGETAQKDLPDKARDRIRKMTRAVADHQVWARKAAAGALGIHLVDKGGPIGAEKKGK